MTKLGKRIRRLVTLELKQGRPEDVIFTVYPGGLLGFRHPRSRRETLLDLRSAYLLAATKAAEEHVRLRRQHTSRNYQ